MSNLIAPLRQGIDNAHAHVHSGEFFSFGYTFLVVADDAFARVHFAISSGQFHYGITVTAEGKSLAKIFRGTTYSNDGTGIDAVNNNCDLAARVASKLTIFHTPVINVLGAELTPENGILITGGLGPQSVGSSIRSSEERVSNTVNVLVEVQNVSGQTKDITIQVGGYQ